MRFHCIHLQSVFNLVLKSFLSLSFLNCYGYLTEYTFASSEKLLAVHVKWVHVLQPAGLQLVNYIPSMASDYVQLPKYLVLGFQQYEIKIQIMPKFTPNSWTLSSCHYNILTLGVCPFTLPARAKDPCTLPEKIK